MQVVHVWQWFITASRSPSLMCMAAWINMLKEVKFPQSPSLSFSLTQSSLVSWLMTRIRILRIGKSSCFFLNLKNRSCKILDLCPYCLPHESPLCFFFVCILVTVLFGLCWPSLLPFTSHLLHNPQDFWINDETRRGRGTSWNIDDAFFSLFFPPTHSIVAT